MQSDFITDKNLYVDVAGNLVDENDPTKLTKIAAAGSRVAPDIVEKYGLQASTTAQKGKPANEAATAEAEASAPALVEKATRAKKVKE